MSADEVEITIRSMQNYMIQTNVKYLELERKIDEIIKSLEVLNRGLFMVIPDDKTKLEWAIEVDKLMDHWGWE